MGPHLEVVAQVTVTADAERVWQAAVDWPRQGEWMLGTRVRGGHGPGAEVTGWTGIGPVGFTDTMVITEWDPPHRCAVIHTGRLVQGSGIFEVIPRTAGTGDAGPACDFRWAERLRLPVPDALARLALPVIVPLARWGLRSSLRRFPRLLAGP